MISNQFEGGNILTPKQTENTLKRKLIRITINGLKLRFIGRNFVRVYENELFEDNKTSTNVTDKHS